MVTDVPCHDARIPRFRPACERRVRWCTRCGSVGAHDREVLIVALTPRHDAA